MPSALRPGLPGIPPFANRALPCNPQTAEAFFAAHYSEAADRKAKQLCGGCPQRLACLHHALQHDEPHGVWGGLDPTERRHYARKHGIEPPVPPLPPAEVERLKAAFRLAGVHIDKGIPQTVLVGQQISRTALSEAVVVLQHAPDLRGDVETGALTLPQAAVQARARKQAAA